MGAAQEVEYPPGGVTPVFNEIAVQFAITPERPAPDAKLEDIDGPTEAVLMQNRIDPETGIVQPTIFVRSDTFVDPNTGLNTQLLALAVDPAYAVSKLLGGEVTVHVRAPATPPAAVRGALPAAALDALSAPPTGGGPGVTPRSPSIGRIQALEPGTFFPASVQIPVHYSFIAGGPDGLEQVATNRSTEAREPHLMEAIVHSIPPDPETVLSAREWNLVDESAFLRLWIKVVGFRFLGLGDWSHTRRLTYKNGRVRG